MKRRSLIYKLIITSTSILASALFILSLILSIYIKNSFYEKRADELKRNSKIVANESVKYLNLKQIANYNTLKDIMDIVANDIEADIFVADNIGFIYAASGDEYENKGFRNLGISEIDMNRLRTGENVEYKTKKDDKSIQEYVYLTPVFDEDYFCGIISVVMPVDYVLGPLYTIYKLIWGTTIIIIVIFSIAIYIVGKKMVLEPLEEINNVANKLSIGEVDKRIIINSNDEISDLANSLNLMAESLETVDRNRREFISNVSHELRSPITSIKGFISGIIDGVIPKDKESYYLNIINDEIRRLSRLVNDLLDISSMESGKFKLNIMEFDINVLIKVCLANLQGKIRDKGLHVQVVLEDKHQFISCDRDRIIQVITNLLDNAIKYSKEGGNIHIETKVKGDKVYISIANDGPFMSEEERIRIWDRFYKSDKARTNKESTGLGLSIVRLILTQHNEDIWVQNNEGKGVTFTFTLTKA